MPRKPKRELYDVEVILGARVNEEDEWDYLVKWWGYPENENTWEPEQNVKGCERLLDSFWNHVGQDDEDHPFGYQVYAETAWIKQEKEYFVRQFAKREIDQSDAKTRTPKNKSKARGKITITLPPRKQLASVRNDLNFPNRSPQKESGTSSHIPRQPHKSTTVSSDIQPNNVQSPPSSPDSLFSKESLDEASLQEKLSKSEPKIKLMGLELRNMSGGSSLSTKQRLIQDLAGSSIPNLTNKVKVVPPRPTKKGPLVTLGFKKPIAALPLPPPPPHDMGSTIEQEANSLDEPLFSEEEYFFAGGAADAEPDLHLVEDRFFFHKSPEPMSSTGLDDAAAVGLVADIDQITRLYHPGDNPIMEMSQLALEPMLDDPVEQHPLMLLQPHLTVPTKIPKKWEWIGALLVDTGDVHTRKLATIRLSDPTATPPTGLSFSTLLAVADLITITRMLTVADLDIVLSACRPFCQVAELGPDNGNDIDLLNSLASFMDNQQQVAVGPLCFENKVVALVVIFPSTLQDLWHKFDVPVGLQQAAVFVAALIPWTMTPAEYSSEDIHSSLTSLAPLDFKRITSQAIQALKFPDDLRKYMKQPNHPYCVWWSPGDGTTSAPGLETKLLHDIMKSCRAKHVKHDDNDVRVVFVHVAALGSLNRSPNIARMRGERSDIHFYAYGSHPSIPLQHWGVRTIYPLGGVVTFTVDALVEDPVGTAQLMRQISTHPFWDCYLLPSAVGLAIRLLCEGVDPLLEFRAGSFVLHDTITLMAESKISLFRATRGQGCSFGLQGWVRSQLKLLALTASGLLEECLSAFSAQYANIPDTDISSVIKGEITENLLHLQSSHPIIENYRRFVVIEATTSANTQRDTVEWTTLERFDTKDGFLRTADHLSAA